MKKMSLIIVLIATSFLFGFAFKTIITNNKHTEVKRVTGIGGIFFKAKDADNMRKWYETHLGIKNEAYGTKFDWRDAEDATKQHTLTMVRGTKVLRGDQHHRTSGYLAHASYNGICSAVVLQIFK